MSIRSLKDCSSCYFGRKLYSIMSFLPVTPRLLHNFVAFIETRMSIKTAQFQNPDIFYVFKAVAFVAPTSRTRYVAGILKFLMCRIIEITKLCLSGPSSLDRRENVWTILYLAVSSSLGLFLPERYNWFCGCSTSVWDFVMRRHNAFCRGHRLFCK